jgi:hypothetical protein
VPFISGPVSVLLVAGALLVALVVWFLRDRSYPGPRLYGDDGIDRDELDEAEREVRDLEPPPPGEDRPGEDWGPGAARPRPPVRL